MFTSMIVAVNKLTSTMNVFFYCFLINHSSVLFNILTIAVKREYLRVIFVSVFSDYVLGQRQVMQLRTLKHWVPFFLAYFALAQLEFVQQKFIFVLDHEKVLWIVRVTVQHFGKFSSGELIYNWVVCTLDIIFEFACKQEIQGRNSVFVLSHLKVLHYVSIVKRISVIVPIPKATSIKHQNINIISPCIDDLLGMG
jgi:hypothetical protein